MTPTPDNPPPTARKKSALAITGFIFAVLSLCPCLGIVVDTLAGNFPGDLLSGLIFLICPVGAIGFGLAALIAIKRSSGKLAGKGLVDGTLVITGLLLVLMLVDALCGPFVERRAKNDSDRARVGAMVQSLCTASKGYYNEYGHWPQPRSSGDLMLIFNGLIDPRTGKDIGQTRPDLLQQNPRRIQFIEFQAKHVTLHGQPQAELALYDPWGTPFAFDNGVGGVYYLGPGMTNAVPWRDDKANDGTIPEPFAATNTTSGVIHAGFAFFSNGPDKKTGTASNSEDDIRSWK